jgi:hypothetical protein
MDAAGVGGSDGPDALSEGDCFMPVSQHNVLSDGRDLDGFQWLVDERLSGHSRGAPADLEVAPTAATSPDHLASVSVIIRYRVRRRRGAFVN